MLTKYTDEKFVAVGAPRSGKTWNMLRMHNPENEVIIVKSEERKQWLEDMARHAHFQKPNVIVWESQKKLPDRKQFDYATIDYFPAQQPARGSGKSTTELIRVLDDIEQRMVEQFPYPYADIDMVRRMRRSLLGDF